MKVWIINEDYFNGEGSSNRPGCVFSSETRAKEYCERMNATRTSGYSTNYEYEERTIDFEENC